MSLVHEIRASNPLFEVPLGASPETLARDFLIAIHGNDAALIDGWRANHDARWLAAVGFCAIRIIPAFHVLSQMAALTASKREGGA